MICNINKQIRTCSSSLFENDKYTTFVEVKNFFVITNIQQFSIVPCLRRLEFGSLNIWLQPSIITKQLFLLHNHKYPQLFFPYKSHRTFVRVLHSCVTINFKKYYSIRIFQNHFEIILHILSLTKNTGPTLYYCCCSTRNSQRTNLVLFLEVTLWNSFFHKKLLTEA